MKLKNTVIKNLLIWLSTFSIALSTMGAGWAQTLAAIDFDITAPVINHEPVARGTAGQMLSITASIEDNVSVKNASIYFLTSTAQQYQQVEMKPDSAAAIWLATIDTVAADKQVKYYIVAEDQEGNRIQKGGQPNPFTVELSDSELSLSSSTKNNQESSAAKQPKYLLLAVGALVAGLLLASSGGGSGDGSILSDDTCCAVTFTVENAGGN